MQLHIITTIIIIITIIMIYLTHTIAHTLKICNFMLLLYAAIFSAIFAENSMMQL